VWKVLGLHTLLAVMAKRRLKDQSYGHFTSSVLARLVFCEMLHGRLSRSQAPSEPLRSPVYFIFAIPYLVETTNRRLQLTCFIYFAPLWACDCYRIRAPNYLHVNLRKGFHGFRGKLLAQTKSAHLLTYILMVPVLTCTLSCNFAR
jgi:hypothetical protein